MKPFYEKILAALMVLIVASVFVYNNQAHAQISIVPPSNTYVRGGMETGVLTLTLAGTSTAFTATAGVRHYIQSANCVNASATNVFATIYDNNTPMAIVLCPASYGGDGAIFWNPPLETGAGDVVNVGVGTAVTSVTISVQGFKGVR